MVGQMTRMDNGTSLPQLAFHVVLQGIDKPWPITGEPCMERPELAKSAKHLSEIRDKLVEAWKEWMSYVYH